MTKTVENRIGKIIYIAIQVFLLDLTLYIFKPHSGDMNDDLMFIGMLFLMGLLSFPVSIIAAPLAFGLSATIVAIFCFLFGKFTGYVNLSPFPEYAVVFLTWLGMLLCGYLQWFWFPRWSDKRLGIVRKQNI